MEHTALFDYTSHPRPGETGGVLCSEQYRRSKDVEAGFMHEFHDDGSPRWTPLFPRGAKDQNDDVWLFHYDSERAGQPEGWQVRRWSDEEDFEWVGLAYVVPTNVRGQDGTSFLAVQLALQDSTNNDIINVLFKDADVRVNHWSSAETMHPLLAPPEHRLGEHAVQGAVELAAA